MDRKGSNVRLTEQAHDLLALHTDGSGISMKDAASDAILLMLKHKRDNVRYRFAAFALGAISGGVLMFFVGLAI